MGSRENPSGTAAAMDGGPQKNNAGRREIYIDLDEIGDSGINLSLDKIFEFSKN